MPNPNNISFYYPTSPQILTDKLFTLHGGDTDSCSPATRQVAYKNAEYLIADYLNTFLSPTTVTGTYVVYPTKNLQTDHLFVNSVESVIVYSIDGSSSCELHANNDSCVYLKNAILGRLDLNLSGPCGCRINASVYQVQVVYTAGIPSGTLYNSTALTALALLAQDELDELTGNSANPGGVGIIEWENQEYREKLMALKQTVFGSTPRSQRIVRLLAPFRYYKYPGL